MNPYDNPAAMPPPPMDAPPPRRRRWLLPAILALAFTFVLGAGVFMGATLLSTARAAANVPGNANIFQMPMASTPGTGVRGPGGHGQGHCDALTVSSVSGQTITAKAADGSAVTIHTSSSTKYTKNGQAASASAVTVGSQIHVEGAHNSDGSINATQIDVR